MAARGLGLPQRLAAQSWDQGCRLPFTRRLFLAAGEEGPQIMFTRQHQQVGSIIVTQACDLLADPADEPYVEAMPIVVLGEEQAMPQPNSARAFALDQEKRWIVDAAHRLQLEKSLIPDEQAEQLLDTPIRRRLFAAWLARRAVRAAFPNDFEATVGQVIKTEMRQKRFAEDPISPHLHLLRVGLPPSDQTKVILTLPFDEERASQQEADAYAGDLREAVRQKLPGRIERVRAAHGGDAVREFEIVALDAVPLDRMTMRLALEMPPLNLEYLTYRRDDIVGAEPHVELES
jgi:hypothetical protein